MTPDAYQCLDPSSCVSDHHHHCANEGCANPNQTLLPPGYSEYCQDCDPSNGPSAEDVKADTGITPWRLRALRRRVP